MTDALTRAARAIRTFYLGGVATETGNRVESCFVGDPDAIASDAILAFLDGEDVVEACARALAKHMPLPHDAVITAYADQHSIERAAKHTEWAAKDRVKAATAAIAALRALVQEDGK